MTTKSQKQEREVLTALVIGSAIIGVALLLSLFTGCGEMAATEEDLIREDAEDCGINLDEWVAPSELRCDNIYSEGVIVCYGGVAFSLQAQQDIHHTCAWVRDPIRDRMCI